MSVRTFDPQAPGDPPNDAGGHGYWRSLEALAQPAGLEALEAEFAEVATPEGMDRRRFLQLMGASLALGGLAACGPAPDTAVPYVSQPENSVPGIPRWYATAVALGGYAQPVLGRTHVGRPTKLEGNPDHPASLGRCDAFTQAAILRLYDPDRAPAPRNNGQESSWQAFQQHQQGLVKQLDAHQGDGLHVLIGANSSATLARQLEAFKKRWPGLRAYRHEPFEGLRYEAARIAFGRPLETRPRLDAAEWIVALDDDLLGPGPWQTANGLGWGQRRQAAAAGNGEARLVVLEPGSSLTGANASERRRVAPGQQRAYVQALAAALGEATEAPTLAEADQRWVQQLADGLKARPGRCLITAGAYAPVDVQAAVHRLNARLGNVGHTLTYSEPVPLLSLAGAPLEGLPALVQAMDAGNVQALLVLDSNPAFDAPGELDFATRMAKVPLRLCASLYYDETAALCHWHLPLSDALDNWSDARAVDGSVCLQQPLVAPFYSSKALADILPLFAGELSADAYTEVRKTFSGLSEAAWRKALELGYVEGSALPAVQADAAPVRLAEAPPVAGLQLVVRPDPTLWDGRFANLGWLQELPKPISQLTWTNVVAIAPALAERLGLGSGDRVRVEADGQALVGPLWVMPGQQEDTLMVYGGHGRHRAGKVADGVGFSITPLQTALLPFQRDGVQVTATGERQRLASTQMHHDLGQSELIRQFSRAQAAGPAPTPAPDQPSLYPPIPARDTSWGMLIDLDQCIGCNACVVACQAENNIPVVGEEQVLKGRQMHWLRVDHYYKGPPKAPTSHFLPVPCMHCEQAPCEAGCPVNATVHGTGGLNEMVYNRCIGTRTCSSFCPYKVRRFNWLDWTADDAASVKAQRNPNVTVRARGVMEKCTYCVQRISEARITARKEGRAIADGEVVTACQQTCPTQAITFGNLADSASRVSQGRASVRHYGLLEELNTRPKTTYLGELMDGPLNPEDS
ncbi:TAT-variant-translocated molybdopterin oxidoreductase [Pseudomonas sp. RIT-PI-S]|uniref:TAT-variant-translocated molybdopterin oxidoreductase n=1 Tax=Pseudomonas sp. RIT-PI-S TaxID=3035295 RepID=UPI0021D88BE3|nr:TAT-variant-translocated molybdopterin oxidoreductase [Pseudomonas sp. RIT-PI-S]